MATIKEIKDELKRRNIKGITGKKKAELLRMLHDNKIRGGGLDPRVKAQIGDIDNTIRSMERDMNRTADQDLTDNLTKTISDLRFRRNFLLSNDQTSSKKENKIDIEAQRISREIRKDEKQKEAEERFKEFLKPKTLTKEEELDRRWLINNLLRQKRREINWRGNPNLRTTRLPNDLKDLVESFLFSQKALQQDKYKSNQSRK